MSVKTARRLRRSMTDAERTLWAKLRDGRLDGIKFRRQHPLGPYVLDFFCEAYKLAVEVDGSQHAASPGDVERTAWLVSLGCRVIRVWNNDVLQHMPSVLEAIRAELPDAPHPRAGARRPLPKGEGI